MMNMTSKPWRRSTCGLLLALLVCGEFTAHAGHPPSPTPLQAAEEVKHVNAEAAARLLEENKAVVVLDIRRPEEFSAGHIKGARNIDFFAADFAEQLQKLDAKKPYLIHCASGGRSTKSLATFRQLGFAQVYHLDGGFNGWQKAGKPVEKQHPTP
jgi:phage shock protein E